VITSVSEVSIVLTSNNDAYLLTTHAYLITTHISSECIKG